MKIFPLAKIRGAIEKNVAANALLARTDTHVPSGTSAPKKGIAKASQFRIVGRKKNGGRKFVPSFEKRMLRSGEALGFTKIVSAVAQSGFGGRCRFYAGIEKRGGAAIFYSAAGKTAILIGAAGSRGKSDGHVFPVDHVGADSVGPVHVSPNGSTGIVLKKYVVVTVPEDGTVRIVHPVVSGKQMKLGTKRISSEASGPTVFTASEGQTS